MTRRDIADKLKSLKKGDFIWVASDESLFKTYSWSCSDKCYQYLGYDPGDADADYDDRMYCIEVASVPLVSKPVKMVLVGKFTNSIESWDVGYVFSSDLHDASNGNYYFGQHILTPYDPWFGDHKSFYLKESRFGKDISMKVENVFFTEEECIKECRERNNKNSRKIDLIKKTVNFMKKQLKDFMTSELYIDHEKKIANDLKIEDT